MSRQAFRACTLKFAAQALQANGVGTGERMYSVYVCLLALQGKRNGNALTRWAPLLLRMALCTCTLNVVIQAIQANGVDAVVQVYSVCACVFVVQGTWNTLDCTRYYFMARLALRAWIVHVAAQAFQAK